MRHPTHLASTALVLGALLGSARARAQDVPPPPVAGDDLESRLRHGVELRQQGHDDQALGVFRAAYETSHSARALAQMGLAEQALGSWLDADTHLRSALGMTADLWIAQNRAALEQSLVSIAQHVGQVDIVSSVAGARVSVNRAVVGRTPLAAPLRLVAGTATVEVSSPGFIPMNRTVVVLAGGRSRESFDLVAVQSGDWNDATATVTGPITLARHAPREMRLSPLIWIGGGVAVGGLIGTLVLGVAGTTIQGDYLSHCQAGSSDPGCAMRLGTQQGQLDGLAEGINVLLGLAGVGAAVLITGLVVSDYGGRPERATTTASRTRRPPVRFDGTRLSW